jgi:2-amino-4-hydroxy-6-hydroxymethyldihydropteridine diphosphokinase
MTVFSDPLASERQYPGVLVVLGLGSNKAETGDSRALLESAVTALGELLPGLRRSSVYETAPLYVTDQPPFLNMAVSGFFSRMPRGGTPRGGTPRELLAAVNRIEAAHGRDRAKERRWGERSLDIDILLFGELIVSESPVLEIPHARLKERRFALEPLLELCPNAVEPGTGRPYRDICAGLPDQEVKKL